MADAFAAAAQVIFADPNLSTAAIYTSPAGVSKGLRVIYTQAADQVVGGGAAMGTLAQSDSAEILQSDVPVRPANGASLMLATGQMFQIKSLAEPAKRGLAWRVVLTDG